MNPIITGIVFLVIIKMLSGFCENKFSMNRERKRICYNRCMEKSFGSIMERERDCATICY